jgi:hypothetical protein
MLQRAQALELGFGSDLECAALEAAADNVRKMKLKIQGDGSREESLGLSSALTLQELFLVFWMTLIVGIAEGFLIRRIRPHIGKTR